mgnify:CR=1 FL=1
MLLGEIRKAVGARAALDPGEELGEGRGEAVPQLFDLGEPRPAHLRQRRPRQPAGEPDPQVAGGELEEREPFRRAEPVQHPGDGRGQPGLAGGFQQMHRVGDAERGAALALPQERDGLGQVADEVVAEREELVVEALDGQPAQQRGGDGPQLQVAGQRSEGIAAVGVRGAFEVMLQKLQLGVARGRERQPLEQVGEPLHSASSS